MIIGRTAENKIKIKTDEPLGLRAVECACCNPCGYDAFIEEEGGGFKKYRYQKITVSGTRFVSSPFSCPETEEYGDTQKTIESTFTYDCQKFGLESNCGSGITGAYGYVTDVFEGLTYSGDLGMLFSFNFRTDYQGATPDGCLAHFTGTYENFAGTGEIDILVDAYAPQWFGGLPCIESDGESVATTITKTKKICVTTYSDFTSTCPDDAPLPIFQSGTATYTIELSNTPFDGP
jgi:hypothetical protein